MNWFVLISAFLCLVHGSFAFAASSATGKRVLVLGESSKALPELKSDFKQLWSLLDAASYEVEFKATQDAELFAYGDRVWDHLLLMAPELKRWGKNTDAQKIVDFVNAGGNVLLLASEQSKQPIRQLASEFGVIMSKSGFRAIDYFASDESGVDTVLTSINDNTAVVSLNSGDLIAFKGATHSLDPANPLVFSLVSGNPTTISWDTTSKNNPIDGSSAADAGQDVLLVSASQARNNARFVFSGSIEMFSDKTLSSKKTKNSEFMKQVVAWVFQEKSVLRTVSTNHHKVGETVSPDHYRIKDEIVYEIQIEQFDSATGQWKPFALPANDKIQLEIVMLDPYIRTNLVASNKTKGVFVSPPNLKLPDQHGVYSFKVTYKRRGYSYLVEKSIVPVRHFRHDEYPRFLSAAYPYYASSGSMMLGFFVFSVVFLYYKDAEGGKKKSQ